MAFKKGSKQKPRSKEAAFLSKTRATFEATSRAVDRNKAERRKAEVARRRRRPGAPSSDLARAFPPSKKKRKAAPPKSRPLGVARKFRGKKGRKSTV